LPDFVTRGPRGQVCKRDRSGSYNVKLGDEVAADTSRKRFEVEENDERII
jgi:hypothetical protein